MKQPVKSEVSNDDIMYLLQKVYEKEDVLEKKFNKLEGRFDGLEDRFDSLEDRFDSLENRFDSLEEKVDTLATSVANMAGDIKDIQENTTVLSHHNSEHFDKDDEQDKRLDTHAKKLGLPAFTY